MRDDAACIGLLGSIVDASVKLVPDASQGVQLETMRKLARYWETAHDWRKVEARLNDLPQFMTEIDGLDIHFIHVRSQHQDALPVIVTHGWPGSIIEQLKIIGPLTDPTAYGASASDAFHVVIPSLPGHGFSGKPTETGWDPQRIARAWKSSVDEGSATFAAAPGHSYWFLVTVRNDLGWTATTSSPAVAMGAGLNS